MGRIAGALSRGMLLLVALTGPLVAAAGANTWTAADVPGASGAQVQFDPQSADRMYALTPSGLYRTTDAGVTWQSTNVQLTLALTGFAVHPADGSRLVMADGDKLYSSQSGAVGSWSSFKLPGTRGPTEFAWSRDGSAVYAIHDARVFRSTDSGVTWQQRGTLPSANFARVDAGPTAAALYVACIGAGIFASTDGGATWQATASQPPDLQITSIAVIPGNPTRIALSTFSGVFISADDGLNWSLSKSGDVLSVASDPSHPQTLYAVDSSSVVSRSADGGGSWVALGTITMLDFPRIALSPARAGRMAVTQGTTVWFSDDGGATWVQRGQGLNAAHVVSISSGTDRSYLGLAGDDLAWIDSGSAVSHPIDSAILKTTPQLGFTKLVAVPGTPDTLLAVSDRGLVVRRANGSALWSAIADLPSSLHIRDIVVSRTEPRVLYAVGSTDIMKSTDRGATWRVSKDGLPAAAQPRFVATGPGSVVYAATVEGQSPPFVYRLYSSADAGAHWIQAGPDRADAILGLSAHPVDPLTVYLQSHVPSDLYRSRDGGQTWTSTGLCCAYGGVIYDERDARIAYAGGGGMVYRTVDGGDTWLAVAPNPLLMNWSYGDAFNLDPKDPNTILLSGGYGFGVHQLRITPDLVLTAAAPATYAPGSPVTLTYALQNKGPFDATHVRVDIQLPGSATGISVSAPGATCASGIAASCVFETMRVAASADIAITATPAGTGSFVVSSNVAADQPDLVPANNSATASVAVATAAPPSQTGGGSSGGGGGGAVSLLLLGALALMLGSSRYTSSRSRLARVGHDAECPRTIRSARAAAGWAQAGGRSDSRGACTGTR